MIEMDLETRERLIKLAAEPCNILLIEDHEDVRKALELVISGIFPQAIIKSPNNLIGEDIEEIIKRTNFEISFLDSSLGNWPEHPIYGSYGPNLIPLIKEYGDESIIISISNQKYSNKEAVRKGATFAVLKGDLGELVEELI